MPATASVVRVWQIVVLLPAVFRPLIIPVEIYVALPPRYVTVAWMLLVLRMLMARMRVPPLIRQPLLALLVKPALLFKAACVAGLPLIPVQV